MLILSSFLVAGALFPRSPLNAHATSSPDDWTTYLYDQQHSGYNSQETIITASSAPGLKLLWSAKTSNNTVISTQPVTANGLVYWGGWDGIMHANKPDGTSVWTANLGQTPTPSGCNGRTHGILG